MKVVRFAFSKSGKPPRQIVGTVFARQVAVKAEQAEMQTKIFELWRRESVKEAYRQKFYRNHTRQEE